MIVHQLLFGYKKGHQLLSSSVKLDQNNIELATRLSDLSGSMTLDSDFHPYLTCYPLPDKKFYVISKTWLDSTASRAGCVLTHALLIPMDAWKSIPNPIVFKQLLIEPQSGDDTENYRKELHLPTSNKGDYFLSESHNIENYISKEFTVRFFSEGISPVVWFTDKFLEDFFWRLVRAFWPKLREDFSCCTFSLQPRLLVDKYFNLMFAPSSAYSRFNQIPRENIIEESNILLSSPTQKIREEPWIEEWAKCLVNSPVNNFDLCGISDEMIGLGPFLTSNPTLIKKLFLVQELHKRTNYSPMASVGMLDIVESIAQDEFAAIEYKEKSFQLALRSVQMSSDLDESLKCLLFLSDRLKRRAYSNLNQAFKDELISTVSDSVLRDPVTVMKVSDRLFTSQNEFLYSTFSKGLVNGLVITGSSKHGSLDILDQFSDASPLLITLEPKIGFYYLQTQNNEIAVSTPKKINNLAFWISKISDKEVLENTRKILLQEIKSDDYKLLAEELLKSLENEEVKSVLDILSISTRDFKFREINNVIHDHICVPYPVETRNWAAWTTEWSSDAAKIIATTYPQTADGIIDLINEKNILILRKAEIIAAFIARLSQNYSLPQWFQDLASNDKKLISSLILLVEPIPEDVSTAIKFIIDHVLVLPIVQVFTTKEINLLIVDSNYSFSPILASAAMRSALSNYLQGLIEWDNYQSWESTKWGEKWLIDTPIRDFQGIIQKQCFANKKAWLRGWKWFSETSDNLYKSNPSRLSKLTESLVSINGKEWELEVTEYWVNIIGRIKKYSGKSSYLQACADALTFAFQHTQLPVSKLVVVSFLPVYAAVTESDELLVETYNLFGYFDWDKGKELRKKIIGAYINSSWPPGDLALATKENPLLRKIYSRLKRYWNGKEYCSSILHDLSLRKDDQIALTIYEELSSLVQQRNFYESWD